MAGAAFGQSILKKETLLNQLVSERKPSILILTECDIDNYREYGTLKIGNMVIFASSETGVKPKRGGAKEKMKVRTILLADVEVFKEVTQVTRGSTNRSECWINCVTLKGEEYMIGGIYQEWTEGGRTAGRDNEGLTRHMQTLVTKKTILTGDWNADARKADEFEHLRALMNMGYKVGHAGDTYSGVCIQSLIPNQITITFDNDWVLMSDKSLFLIVKMIVIDPIHCQSQRQSNSLLKLPSDLSL